MPRFVVLRHEMPETDTRPSHWDLMIESDVQTQSLATWALELAPDSGGEQAVRRLADHRTLYLEFQGPIPGGRGSVHSWDRGICSISNASRDCWQLHLQGDRLRGHALLTREGDEEHWRYCYTPDP